MGRKKINYAFKLKKKRKSAESDDSDSDVSHSNINNFSQHLFHRIQKILKELRNGLCLRKLLNRLKRKRGIEERQEKN